MKCYFLQTKLVTDSKPMTCLIRPAHAHTREKPRRDGIPVREDYCYTSDTNSRWLTREELYRWLGLHHQVRSIASHRPENDVNSRNIN